MKITIDKVVELFSKPEVYPGSRSLRRFTLSCRKLDRPNMGKNNIEISVSSMYEHPIEANFAFLKKVSELFQTDKVDVNDWGMKGCQTCDFGSNYGHSFQIYDIPLDIQDLLDKGNIIGDSHRAFGGW